MKSTLDKYGRILIPKKLRKKLGLKPGDNLVMEATAEYLIIKEVKTGKRKVGEDKGQVRISANFDDPLEDFELYQ